MGRALLSPDGRAPENTTWTEMNALEARCARWRSGAGAESSAETPCPCVDASTSGRAANECDPPNDDRGPFISYFAVGLFLAVALLAALLATCKRRFRDRSVARSEEDARAEREEIERRKKDAYDRWVRKGVLVTQPDETTCVVTLCAPDDDATRTWEEAVGKHWAEPTTLPRPQPALPHVVIRVPSFKLSKRRNVDMTRDAEEETDAARPGTESERREDGRDGDGDEDGDGDGDGNGDGDGSGSFPPSRQDSGRSWTSGRSGSSEASGSGTRREDECE